MSLKEGLIQAVVVLSIFGGFGYIIFSKLTRKNSRTTEFFKKLTRGKLYEKVVPNIDVQDKIEQVWDDRRTMM